MTGHSHRTLDFRQLKNPAIRDAEFSTFRSSPLKIVDCEDRDRLHWARSRLNSVLEHEPDNLKTLVEIKRGESACVEGQVADALILIRRGLVKLSLVSVEGTQSAAQIIGAGECFGEECACEGQPHYGETAIAVTPTHLAKIARKHILKKLDESHFAKLYISAVVHRVHEYEDLLAQRALEASEQRLRRVLARLTKFGNWQNGNMVVVPRITHATLSEIVGTTRSRITLFMGRLAKRGVILNAGPGLVIDSQRLLRELFNGSRKHEL